MSLLYRMDRAVQNRILAETECGFYDEIKVKIRCSDHPPNTLYITLPEAWRRFKGCTDYFRDNALTHEEAEMITVHLTFPDRREKEVYHSCTVE